MKLKIRTLKQDKYELDIDDSTTVRAVKEMIEARYNHKASWQILIFSGKVLSSDHTVKWYNVTENDFLVLMVKKPKDEEDSSSTKAASPASSSSSTSPPAASSQTAPASAPASSSSSSGSSSGSEASSTAPAQGQAAGTGASGGGGGGGSGPVIDPISGQPVDALITALVEMGFPRDQAMLALRASFFNLDRAVEYLTNGIPTGMAPGQAPGGGGGGGGSPGGAAYAQPRRVPVGPGAAVGGGGGGGAGAGGMQLPANLIPPGLLGQQPPQQHAGGMFDFLRNHPQFPLLQQIAREDPARLTEVLQQLAQTNPEIIQLIVQHRDEFIRLLAGDPGAGGRAPPPGTIMVTPEDKVKIQNLVAITGASRERVMQAYFLFEKDETMAVNYLLNNPEEDIDDAGGDDGAGADH